MGTSAIFPTASLRAVKDGVPLISVQKVTVPIRPESEHLRGSGSLAQGKSLSGNDFLLVPHSACEALFVGLISCGGACFAGRL